MTEVTEGTEEPTTEDPDLEIIEEDPVPVPTRQKEEEVHLMKIIEKAFQNPTLDSNFILL